MVPNFAQPQAVPRRGGREGRKRFFLEKKKQKTFIRLGRSHDSRRRAQDPDRKVGGGMKFFCFFLFTKRRLFLP
jgi:hypothetical protein